MTSVLLVYPFFRRSLDRSRFRFPPLGVAYVAAALRDAGHAVEVLDCTFLSREEALRKALAAPAAVVGIYCMVTMLDDCLVLATALRQHDGGPGAARGGGPGAARRGERLLVAGGPLPTCEPSAFLAQFDAVVRGEGEQTMVELLAAFEAGTKLDGVPGVVCRRNADASAESGQASACAPPRPFETELDRLAFPARELLPNGQYIEFGRRKYGFSITTVMSTRGCPFACEFCSNVVFGHSYRERSASNVVDEVEQALALGYDRISFGDDVFTLNARRVLEICDEIGRRGLRFDWECLGRVDTFDQATARAMRQAGCFRIFFGIESGNDRILKLMNKQITTAQAAAAVEAARDAGLEVGAFFIVCYPGETDDTVLDTLRFATSLPLDYLGLTMPYPLPGTALFDRIGDRVTRQWRPQESLLLNHVLTFAGDFSALKMRFAILKGRAEFTLRRRLRGRAPLVLRLFEESSDAVFRLLR
jgi:anaerobic magnesium-protoporphyrin IX monomethyl ester cyclase